ncbi:SRPBCC domain-containing protein [Cryptosporangium minutisporangium]|uniref:SRPBCC domain-containing protein n=1 Tax=Cryptosporangium minutisporangium TaxID=113569 RepID=A0ABP6SSP9_9ACTN
MPETYRWDGTLPADTATTWDAVTRHTAGWQWHIEYEPRLGGTERGLTPNGGTVTAWQPGRHFRTRAEGADGWFNELDLRLEDGGDQGTHLHLTHTSSDLADDLQYAQCAAHTNFYLHSLEAYLRWFAGRDPQSVEVNVPGSFAEVCDRIGARGNVYYRTLNFLGLRDDDTIVRVFGRDVWGDAVGVSVHSFTEGAGAAEWRAWAEGLAPVRV